MDKKEDKLNFEEAIRELEEIVLQLEKGELNLDDSMKKFEEGVSLSKRCSKYLEEAERKISILLKRENGTIAEEDFQ